MTLSSLARGFGTAAVVDAVVARPGFDGSLGALAGELGLPPEELERRVRACLSEMVVVPSPACESLAAQISQVMVSLGYESPACCDPAQLERLRALMADHPTALLWTHKSHVDGAAVIATLAEYGFPPVHSFGGANMAFAGVGYVGRRSGTIFIRRSFQDDRAYKFALRQYLGYLMAERRPLSWAFEGTRSRIGKLMPPRLGLLKYVVEAAAETNTRSLKLVPIAISYDLISDVEDYASEEAGEVKRAESMGWFMGYLRRLRRPMGRLYLDIGEPVSIDDPSALLAEGDLYKTAFRVAVNANSVTPVTLPAIVSLVLLGALPRALAANELSERVMALVSWAQRRHIPLTSGYGAEDREQLDGVMELMIARGLLTRFDRGPQVVYGLGERQHGSAGYYRNTALHFFLAKAIAELALLAAATRRGDRAAAVLEEALWIRNLFKHEFYFSPSDAFTGEIERELDAMHRQWRELIADGEAGATRILAQGRPLVAHATLLDFLDAYLIVLRMLESAEDGGRRSRAEAVRLALDYGRQAYLQRTITSDASIGRQVMENACRWCEEEVGLPSGPALAKARRRLERLTRSAELLASYAALGRWERDPTRQ